MDEEEKAHLLAMRTEYIKRRRVLELQAVKFGNYVPAHIQVEIDDIDLNIQWIDEQLSRFSTKRVNEVQNAEGIRRYLKKEFLNLLVFIVGVGGIMVSIIIVMILGGIVGIVIDMEKGGYPTDQTFAIIFSFGFAIIYGVFLYKHRYAIENEIKDYIFDKFG